MGHAFNIETPEETNKIIWNFLQKYMYQKIWKITSVGNVRNGISIIM